MTPRQTARLQEKIKQIKAALAADKKRWGGFYDDSRGLRYLPPRYYLQLGDYAGGLRYVKWFHKNFEDDCGFPDFLFEWTVILFKTGKLKDAAQKAFQTYCRNTYLFDKFFARPIVPIEKGEYSNLEIPSYVNYFTYSHLQPDLADFSEWLQALISSEKFISASAQFVEIQKRLKTEEVGAVRSFLVDQGLMMERSFSV